MTPTDSILFDILKVLEAMFAVGIIGSAVVLILTGIEDIRDIRGKD